MNPHHLCFCPASPTFTQTQNGATPPATQPEPPSSPALLLTLLIDLLDSALDSTFICCSSQGEPLTPSHLRTARESFQRPPSSNYIAFFLPSCHYPHSSSHPSLGCPRAHPGIPNSQKFLLNILKFLSRQWPSCCRLLISIVLTTIWFGMRLTLYLLSRM